MDEIATLIAKVKKPARLQDVDETLATLRSRRDSLQDEIGAIATASGMPGSLRSQLSPRLREVTAEKAEVDRSIAVLRREQEVARQQHIAALRAKLTPIRSKAEHGLVQAFGEILDHWRTLDAITAELHRAGDRPAQHATAVQVQILFEPLVRKATGGLVMAKTGPGNGAADAE